VKYTFGDVTNNIDLYGRFIATDISYVIKHIYLDVNGDEYRLVTEVIPAKVDQYVAQVHQLPEE
jgi:mRNA-degrading endonuclease HigB of HigAB toxin-antitoxin module